MKLQFLYKRLFIQEFKHPTYAVINKADIFVKPEFTSYVNKILSR